MDRQVDLVIIGAGPAGMTAALYASRAGLQTLMLDGGAPGGALLTTYMVDNYPGCPQIPGPDLAMQMYEQSVSFGAQFQNGMVDKVTENKQVILKDGSVITAKAVIVATGVQAKKMNIPGEAEALGHGVSFCAICDGAFFRNQEVVVIGGGNSALEEAVFLTRFASKVTIVIRRDQFRGSLTAQKAVEDNDKIEVIRHHIPKEVLSTDGRVSGIVLENVNTHDQITLKCGGIFPYIGQIPETGFVKDLGLLDERGYLIVDDSMKTAIPGIYGAGDCTNKKLRQIVTATADGAAAAEEAFHFITGI